MRYFFIDLENVRNEGLEGVLSLTEEDMVYIFYSENAFSMAIPTLESITNSRCSSKFIKTNYIGKNAMDFQIVSLFGATIERSKEGSFYIISKDNGFRSAVSFCESFFENYNIKCGVFPRIITAIAADARKQAGEKSGTDHRKQSGNQNSANEKKQSDSNTAAVQDESNSGQKAGEGDTPAKSRSRRRRRGRGAKNVQDEHNTGDAYAVAADPAFTEKTVITDTADTGSDDTGSSSTAEPADKTERKSRSRSRSRKKKQELQAAQNQDITNVTDPAEIEAGQAEPEKEDNASESVAAKKSGRSRRNRRKDKNPDTESRTQDNNTAAPGTAVPDTAGEKVSDKETDNPHGQFAYIYELLGEFLSERTIDLYAGYIDEGISGTSNREELQKYFRENLGDDEGEALYKVVKSDYEKYKQARGRRSSRSRRHRSRKNGQGS